ncbi:hypothetical protein EDD21DRAFT_366924 [Dissophora ornata]|nr:hypothetical protein EDD21DRAFT_366924 [Dissophora ornata]
MPPAPPLPPSPPRDTPAATEGALTSPIPSSGQSTLLSEIQTGAQLKVVITNDRSTPAVVDSNSSTSAALRSPASPRMPGPPPPPPTIPLSRNNGAMSPTTPFRPAPGLPTRAAPPSPDNRPMSPISTLGFRPAELPAIEGRWAFRSTGDLPMPPLSLYPGPKSYPSGNSSGTSIPLDLTSLAGLPVVRAPPPPPPIGSSGRLR